MRPDHSVVMAACVFGRLLKPLRGLLAAPGGFFGASWRLLRGPGRLLAFLLVFYMVCASGASPGGLRGLSAPVGGLSGRPKALGGSESSSWKAQAAPKVALGRPGPAAPRATDVASSRKVVYLCRHRLSTSQLSVRRRTNPTVELERSRRGPGQQEFPVASACSAVACRPNNRPGSKHRFADVSGE